VCKTIYPPKQTIQQLYKAARQHKGYLIGIDYILATKKKISLANGKPRFFNIITYNENNSGVFLQICAIVQHLLSHCASAFFCTT